jgi:hypothetical protein
MALAAACALAACSSNMKPQQQAGRGSYSTGRVGQSLSAAAQTDPAAPARLQRNLGGRSAAPATTRGETAPRKAAALAARPSGVQAPSLLADLSPEARSTVFESRALQAQVFLGPRTLAAPGAGPTEELRPATEEAAAAPAATSPRASAPVAAGDLTSGPLPWVLGILGALALAVFAALMLRRRSKQRELLGDAAVPVGEVEPVREAPRPPVRRDEKRPDLVEPAADAPYVFKTQHLIPPSREELVHALHAQSRDAEQLLSVRPVDVQREEVASLERPGQLGIDDGIQHSLFPAGQDLGAAEPVKAHQPVGLVQSVFTHKWGRGDGQPGGGVGNRTER